ncbi:efflux RND transporter periplasmic adaptor subunit (plasmid) [Pseudoalteromonas lipolytica]|jgi:membrane fusion protein (multidrug efflux system)|uniref:Efflux RND transporter periplasmic adaptor subunit n=3 Tax=Pseudoalteromonas TaxID=53246 RepID=A0AAD0WE47_9GAMM|nr:MULTISPECIES: efflux RND transporter periplasmic adaptor subunit [Pseudoalteromonas]AXV67179.1 efflux RND transporter periplasmic adaptor subunit [Pseudoalteromonas donghaensis]MBE0353292.1 membrane fusion protein [Pseudoalteromonas lipolytica LMEB 39]MCC9660515.1 efflux RND transporter periplasmic adaptor subunit [Pseudoalteromonas sp. MB41]QLJ10413.1 efflux RND transporter periplasmic adaptor subunit [Pseudoalteromonas sp. JSTW]QMW16558.1 efflux RND transporter periplasmic adaptor subunit|tara:strand:+ start:6016 stop:7179 length:1164 start_codon:yes stop_codon:yes gene_type:complete
MHRSRIPFFAVSALAAAVLLSGCGQSEPAQGQMQAAQAVPVGVIEMQSKPLTLTKELPGRVSASRIAEIRPQVNGIIQSRLFVEGAEVEKGQALYQIDPSTFEAQVATSKAAITKAEASISNAKAKSERYKELLSIKAVSQQDFDEADAAYKGAKADLLTAQAQLKTAQINLNYSKVLAPISGQIGKSNVTAGALVSANQATALATITQLDPIFVDLTQSSSELTRLKKAIAAGELDKDAALHSNVELKMEDGSTYQHKGVLKFSEVTVDPSTGSVTLRAEFPNPEKLLLPGMYVRAVVVEGVKSDAILAPQRGVSRNTKGEPTAMVVSKDNTVEARVLKTDRTVGSNWLVTEGLNNGDKLIVEGLQKIRPGAPVNPMPAETTANSQ